MLYNQILSKEGFDTKVRNAIKQGDYFFAEYRSHLFSCTLHQHIDHNLLHEQEFIYINEGPASTTSTNGIHSLTQLSAEFVNDS